MCSQNNIYNDATITNNDVIHSYEISNQINISTILRHDQHSQRIVSTYSSILTSNTHTILPPFGKENMCFMKEGKSDQAARCIESSIMTKVSDYVLSIDTFEQKIVVLKGMLRSL